jgi:hypothetical protein
LIDFNEDDYEYYQGQEEEPPEDMVNALKTQLNALSLEDKAKLAEELGGSEDFPTA